MIHTTHHAKGLFAGALAALLLTACSGGGDTKPPADASNANKVVAEGEGVSLNEYGGAQLERSDAQKGGSLRLGMMAPVDTLDPTTALSTPGINAATAIFETLMAIGPEGEAIPGMAESLESEDQLTWTLKLREGVMFTDGTPYDADAVVAHLTRYAAPESQGRQAAAARQIVDMKVVDPLTLEMKLAAPSVEFPVLFTAGAGMVPSPTAVEKSGASFGQKPVGAGAFKVKSFQPGGDLVLERNPEYRIPELPYLDEIVMVTATDTEARLSAIKAGSLDLAPTQSVTDLEEAGAADLTVLQQPAYTYFYLALNTSQPPFDDERVRKALLLGIDREALATAVFEGKHPAMEGYFTGNHPEYVETDFPEFDADEAKKLIEEYVAEGGDASFEMTSTSPPEFQRQASVLQQMLSDIGVEMKIRISDQPTMITEAAAGNYSAQLRFIGITLQATSDLQGRFHSKSPANIARGGDAEVDKLIEELLVTPVAERGDLYAQVQEAMTRWMPSTPTVGQIGGWIASDEVGGFPGSKGEQTVDIIDLRYIWAS
ncbi:ABC transporter substrate-binding protein [Nocardioides sp. cx-173]|uniref:ABC transporter substrate-binding protein n=1 Tax=Nocardioides sp. cx-173 TaxID=2898796 RepID=UPI001E523750|nr:ABC transporter substrate-binding protein [Nocardioides sp. cx-173]MCD4526583.1 ABC transporter substrate-binding protein [Nocardioides sp. cx-173]UGB40678.1 ABC transporter substrate-binding protein [Nocardioides sp. cx-173]